MTYNSNIGSYTYRTPGTGQPHAVQTAGARSYVYDTIGQMTSRNGQVIQWNGDGKPSSIGSVAFTYGGTGERLKKVSGSDTTRYVGGNYEIAPNGTVTKYLIGGKQVDTSFFINHSDHLGSIQAVTDAAGVEVRRQAHTPFGDQHYATGSHAESKGWIGEREEETELVYLNARYYDPEIGRFTAPDPIVRLGQKLNRYSYSRNNPINFSDPSGLDECTGTSTGPTNSGVNCKLDGPSSAVVPLRLPGELAPPTSPGIPLNALMDFFTDARDDLKALAEQDAEALAALRALEAIQRAAAAAKVAAVKKAAAAKAAAASAAALVAELAAKAAKKKEARTAARAAAKARAGESGLDDNDGNQNFGKCVASCTTGNVEAFGYQIGVDLRLPDTLAAGTAGTATAFAGAHVFRVGGKGMTGIDLASSYLSTRGAVAFGRGRETVGIIARMGRTGGRMGAQGVVGVGGFLGGVAVGSAGYCSAQCTLNADYTYP